MKSLVLLGEGHGERSALPTLVRRLVAEKGYGELLYVDSNLIRVGFSGLVKWDKPNNQPDYSEWISRVMLASRHRNVGGVLVVYDGDVRKFPAGSSSPFCARTAAKLMAGTAAEAGAGKMFSLAVVFACVEYESWLIAGAESLVGRFLDDGRPALLPHATFPAGDPESHGKRWLEQHCPNYRPSRDQDALTKLIDFQVVREKKLRSFQRLEHALEQLANAVANGTHISSPY